MINMTGMIIHVFLEPLDKAAIHFFVALDFQYFCIFLSRKRIALVLSVYELNLPEEYLSHTLDLELFMDESPHSATWMMTIEQTFDVMRGVGLRHLPVLLSR